MDFTLLLGVTKEALKLWNTKEGNKYLDKINKLEKEYNEELDKKSFGKPYSQLTLDECMRELKTISKNFLKDRSTKQAE